MVGGDDQMVVWGVIECIRFGECMVTVSMVLCSTVLCALLGILSL